MGRHGYHCDSSHFTNEHQVLPLLSHQHLASLQVLYIEKQSWLLHCVVIAFNGFISILNGYIFCVLPKHSALF